MHLKSIARGILISSILGLPVLAVAEERRVLADFEANQQGDLIAKGATEDSRPWRRFGAATADNIIATDDALAGKVSAMYPLVWPGRFAATRMVSDKAMDLTAYKTASLSVKSDAKNPTKITLQISDGKTTFESKTALPVTDVTATVKFDLDPAKMARVDGPPADFAKVLAVVTQIGFKLVSDGSKYSEKVTFDDLAVE